MKNTAKKGGSLIEQSLIDSEIRYRRLFEAAQDGILILDAKTGMIEDVNPYLIKLLGYSHKEFIKKKLWEVGAFKDIKASRDTFKALQKNETIRYEDLPFKTKDGQLIQVEFVSNVYLVGGKKVIQCNIRDITEHRRIIVALQENEKKYYDMVNQGPDGAFIIDLSGRILTVNKAMTKELGFSEEEFLSMNMWEIIPKQYLNQHKKRLTKILKGKSLEEAGEYAVRGKDGKLHYVEVLSAPHYSGKAIIGFQGIARDITAHKLVEEALQESEERYRLLVETLPDGVVVHSQGHVVFANPACAKIIGAASPAELIGKPVIEFVHPDYRELALKRIQQSLSEGVPVPLAEEKFVQLDGTLIDIEVSAFPFSYAGKPAMLTVFNDITERKQAEQEIVSLAKFPSENPEPVLRLSRDGIVMYANAESGALLGMWGSAVGGPAPQFWRDLAAQALASRENKSVDIECDGKVYAMAVIPVTEPGYVNLYGRDITGHVRVEEELKESKALMDAVVENVPLMVFVKEATDLRFVIFNRAGEELLGYDRKALLGKNNLDLFPPEQAAHFMAKDREVLDGEAGMLDIPEEPILTAKKGQRLLHTLKVCIQGADGVTKYLLGISEDITERKQAEDEIKKQLEELQRWHNATLGREIRILSLKREVNELLGKTGQPPRYSSAELQDDKEK